MVLVYCTFIVILHQWQSFGDVLVHHSFPPFYILISSLNAMAFSPWKFAHWSSTTLELHSFPPIRLLCQNWNSGFRDRNRSSGFKPQIVLREDSWRNISLLAPLAKIIWSYFIFSNFRGWRGGGYLKTGGGGNGDEWCRERARAIWLTPTH